MADVFRWTGHFPEKTRSLMRDLAKRADALRQVYPRAAEAQAIVGVTTLVTSLAMNFVHRGAYFPETAAAAGASQTQAVPGGGAGAASASGAGGGGGSSPARGGAAGADPDDKGE